MALRVSTSRAAAESRGVPADSCGPAACKMELRPRSALVNIGNRVAEPRTRSGGKKAAVKAAGARGQEPGTRPVLAKALEKRTREAAVKKVLSPVPKTRSQPEPMQLEPQSSGPMETSGCAPSGDVLCQAFSDVLLDIEDVDVNANADTNSCSSYMKNIYKYLRDLEYVITDNAVTKRKLQLVGVAAMFIASKYEEILSPTVEGFVCIDFEQHILAKYLIDLSIVNYDMVHFPPSKIAAAASCLSLKLKGHKWTPTLQYHMSYTERDLLPVTQHIAKSAVLVNEGVTRHMAMKKKYSMSKNIEISSSEELKSSIIQHLAQPLVPELTPL